MSHDLCDDDDEETVTFEAVMNGVFPSRLAIKVSIKNTRTGRFEARTIPVSVIHENSEIYEKTPMNEKGKLIIPLWFAEKEGLPT